MATYTSGGAGYAVLEINQLESRTTGAMIADAPLANDFTCKGKDGAGQDYAENGMILSYKPSHTNCEGEKGAVVGDGTGSTWGLVYATEHLYDNYHKALSDYRIVKPNAEVPGAKFYPRLYTLKKNDKFTTNAVDITGLSYNNGSQEKNITSLTEVPVGMKFYPGNGYITANNSATNSGIELEVIKATTCPNGIDPALKFIVTKA